MGQKQSTSWPESLSDTKKWQPSHSEVPIDSYIHQHGCSGRNITWQYLHAGDGKLPWPYSQCPDSDKILKLRSCKIGICREKFSDQEFHRYKWHNWDGLGDPLIHDKGTETETAKDAQTDSSSMKYKRAQLPNLSTSDNSWKGMPETAPLLPHYGHTAEDKGYKVSGEIGLEADHMESGSEKQAGFQIPKDPNRKFSLDAPPPGYAPDLNYGRLIQDPENHHGYKQPQSNLLAPNPLLDSNNPLASYGDAESPILSGTDSISNGRGIKPMERFGIGSIILAIVLCFVFYLAWKRHSKEKFKKHARQWRMFYGMDRTILGPWDPRSERGIVVENGERRRYTDAEGSPEIV